MKYTADNPLTLFPFWSGAAQHEFTYDELELIEDQLEMLYPDGMTETQINDLFWFEEEFLCGCIGLDIDEYNER